MPEHFIYLISRTAHGSQGTAPGWPYPPAFVPLQSYTAAVYRFPDEPAACAALAAAVACRLKIEACGRFEAAGYASADYSRGDGFGLVPPFPDGHPDAPYAAVLFWLIDPAGYMADAAGLATHRATAPLVMGGVSAFADRNRPLSAYAVHKGPEFAARFGAGAFSALGFEAVVGP